MSQTCHEETHAPQLLPLGLGRFLTPFCLEHNRSGAHGILSTAVVLTMTDPKAFKTGREFAAWIGLVPRQNSTQVEGTPRLDFQAGRSLPVPVVNQIRTYWWCSPPKIGRRRMRPVAKVWGKSRSTM